MSQIRRGETERASYWSGLVQSWEGSGLSQAEFCRRRGINGGTFAWWKRRLRRSSGEVPRRRGRPGKVAGLTGASSAYEVVLARGRSIRVPVSFDPQILSRLITAVESC
jgi:hypothetical protein